MGASKTRRQVRKNNMPFVSQKQAKWMFANHPTMAKEWASKTRSIKALPVKKKAKIAINNKLKGALGSMNPKTNEIQINIKKHKGDRRELASTIKHELMHVKHPKMTEKEVYKRTAKTKIPPMEQSKLIAKLRHKTLNYKTGALKRKFKVDKSEKVEPGYFINKANEQRQLSKRDVAIRGLI